MVGLASLAFAAGPVAAADPRVSNADGALQVALAPPPDPGFWDSLFYNVPVYRRYASPSPYNAPWEGGGFYFGPTGSLSVLRDSDIIKRLEPRTTDTLLSMPRSITSDSTSWRIDSGSSSWIASSNPWRLNTEGGSKTRVLSSSTGYDVGARAGYQFNNFRTEFQFDYANNSVDTFGNPNRTFSTDFVLRDRSASGSTTSKALLINGFFDVNVPYLNGFGATPYIGGGIGAGETSLDLKWGNRTIVNSSDWGFAYQLGAGVRYQVTPNLSLDLGYRYRAITDVTLRNDFERIIVPNRSHNFEVSFLWNFPPLWGAPAPATPYTMPPPYTPPPYTPPPYTPPPYTPPPYTPPPPPPPR